MVALRARLRCGSLRLGANGTVSSPIRRQRTFATVSNANEYTCDLDEEPVQCYRAGGYHPVHLGDSLDDGRFTVLHKLGWGAFSTVWAAKDTSTNDNVAIKILQAAASGKDRELLTLSQLREHQSQQGIHHLNRLHHVFRHSGPNGEHDCLVLDLTGPSVQDYTNRAHIDDGRLPGSLARSIARQTLEGLSCLHSLGLGHGDVHVRNLVLGAPSSLRTASPSTLDTLLGRPITAEVLHSRSSTAPSRDSGIPRYLVQPSRYPADGAVDRGAVRLVDFGAAFRGTMGAGKLLNPAAIRPPEAVFGDDVDWRVDLWSMGCTLFELVTGHTPFETGLRTEEALAAQMVHLVADDLPPRWRERREALVPRDDRAALVPASDLQQWLELLYFDQDQASDFLSREEIRRIGGLVAKLMRFEPGERASAEEVLRDPWFADMK